jgi:hypothetical protein
VAHRKHPRLVTQCRVTGVGVEWEPPPGPGHHQVFPAAIPLSAEVHPASEGVALLWVTRPQPGE